LNGSSTTSYFLPDVQGSTRALTNASGAIISGQTFDYSAFGDLVSTGTPNTDYLYTGQQFDTSTGLYSLRARYYDPGVGRFNSRDTWAYDFQKPMEFNRYVYTAGNPVNYSDPSGHAAFFENAKLRIKSTGAAVVGFLTTVGNRVYEWLTQVYVRLYSQFIQSSQLECLAFEIGTGVDVPGCGTYAPAHMRGGGGGSAPIDPPDGRDYTSFYHGTTPEVAESIRQQGVSLDFTRPNADFGRGFYTSTSQETAEWSAQRFGGSIEVIEFQIPNDELQTLNSLEFPGPTQDWADFVDFHKRISPEQLAHGGQYYETVTGPLFARYGRNGEVRHHEGHNQTSIHTQRAIDLFNRFMVR